MANIKLIGVNRFRSQKGNEICLLTVARPYSPEENENGKYGSEIRTEFAPREQIDSFKASDIGKTVEFEFGFNDRGRPTIIKVNLK